MTLNVQVVLHDMPELYGHSPAAGAEREASATTADRLGSLESAESE